MSTPVHRATRQVRFQHCDPAGIVFYPRYFELLEEIVTTWLASLTDAGSEAALLAARGEAPRIERLECRFSRPSLLGEHIDYTLEVRDVDAARVTLDYRIQHGTEERVAGTIVLRWYRFAPRPEAAALPPTLRTRLGPPAQRT
ncbi:1,4-dihydroxy-2-naphthoyl-CoA hydrolase [wastewater metagenome]|uniref:1,4-dihydroxy-2-naphthoyl-CoA hydrolase n=2 Tax=unclassified sequences TaxID=12908 RepID=A0A5B8RAI0_9ZZZZ|nr:MULTISPECIES: acyl-CoA thioesterase [Arhodomonas]MCS4503992.1 acyl-CoA thioesterase [Arhodomonas aquaeolei]QEA05780.1 1,4-dihydroxy-2-naphthoyl-CoA hydrolase [uncultured organism]